MGSHYATLGVARNALVAAIRKRFKQLLLKHHPDVHASASEEERAQHADTYREMMAAYEVLKSPSSRAAYDQQQAAQERVESRPKGNPYYGEARYYSKSHGPRPASGINRTRHRVHYGAGVHARDASHFHGKPQDHTQKVQTLHFDYDQHLERGLQSERRAMDRRMDRLRDAQLLQPVGAGRVPVSEQIRQFQQLMENQHKPLAQLYNRMLDEMIRNAEQQRARGGGGGSGSVVLGTILGATGLMLLVGLFR